MLGKVALVQLLLGSSLVAAQQPAAPAQTGPGVGATATGQPGKASEEAVKLTAKILSSYYHPDNLPGLECDAAPDWQSFFASAKVTVPAQSMQGLAALKIHVHAVRDQAPELTFNWGKGPVANADQMQALLKKTIDDFYQVYWNVFASPAVKYAATITKIEPQPGGTTKVYESDPNAFVVMTVEKDGTPTHYTMQSPSVTGAVDAHYARSPHPVAGDRRRITEVEVNEQSGGTSMKLNVSVDYQPVGEYFVPKQVSIALEGAYTMPLEFSGCAVLPAPAK